MPRMTGLARSARLGVDWRYNWQCAEGQRFCFHAPLVNAVGVNRPPQQTHGRGPTEDAIWLARAAMAASAAAHRRGPSHGFSMSQTTWNSASLVHHCHVGLCRGLRCLVLSPMVPTPTTLQNRRRMSSSVRHMVARGRCAFPPLWSKHPSPSKSPAAHAISAGVGMVRMWSVVQYPASRT